MAPSAKAPTTTTTLPADNDLALWRVEMGKDVFYLVASDRQPGDFAKQLAKALGLKMTDPLPKPIDMWREPGRVHGRVKP